MRYGKVLGLAAVTLVLGCTEASDPVAPPTAATPKPALNSSVTGAAFTTVNEDQDGPDHCKNGNPNNNCNIYDGKQYVWLNGGPSVAYVGDGSYFFAVLEPGGQKDPNDGGASNLSDTDPAGGLGVTGGGDSYTQRTFTVTNGV